MWTIAPGVFTTPRTIWPEYIKAIKQIKLSKYWTLSYPVLTPNSCYGINKPSKLNLRLWPLPTRVPATVLPTQVAKPVPQPLAKPCKVQNRALSCSAHWNFQQLFTAPLLWPIALIPPVLAPMAGNVTSEAKPTPTPLCRWLDMSDYMSLHHAAFLLFMLNLNSYVTMWASKASEKKRNVFLKDSAIVWILKSIRWTDSHIMWTTRVQPYVTMIRHFNFPILVLPRHCLQAAGSSSHCIPWFTDREDGAHRSLLQGCHKAHRRPKSSRNKIAKLSWHPLNPLTQPPRSYVYKYKNNLPEWLLFVSFLSFSWEKGTTYLKNQNTIHTVHSNIQSARLNQLKLCLFSFLEQIDLWSYKAA